MPETGEFELSGGLATHAKLLPLGVPTAPHAWKGTGHAKFAFNPRLPESDEVHNVFVEFFDMHLGQR